MVIGIWCGRRKLLIVVAMAALLFLVVARGLCANISGGPMQFCILSVTVARAVLLRAVSRASVLLMLPAAVFQHRTPRLRLRPGFSVAVWQAHERFVMRSDKSAGFD